MTEDDRLEYLERRVAFLEATLARLLALVLHGEEDRTGKTKAKRRAHAIGTREVIENALDSALIDLTDRADLTVTERLAMPDPRHQRGTRDEEREGGGHGGRSD